MTEKGTYIAIPAHAQKALSTLERAGFEGWLVGGFVRDAIMGRSAYDVDIATNARWEQAAGAFSKAGFTVHETGVKHGTITVVVDELPIEVTTYRQDGEYSDNRHPDQVVFVGNIQEDLARRDFTMNAIAYHPHRGFCDPFQGIADIEAGVIRTVGDPRKRFSEDALRILRAARFQSQLGFAVDPDTVKAMNELSGNLTQVAVERQMREWDKLLCGSFAHDAIMENVDVLGATIPEILPMKGFDQQTRYHCHDVLEHTAYVVQYVKPIPLLRWAALFHDIGKPSMFTIDERGHGHFKGHAYAGSRIAERITARLKMSPAFARRVVLLVQQHDDRIHPTLPAVKRRLAKLDYDPFLFECLCDLKRADALAHAPNYRDTRAQLSRQLLDCLERIVEERQPYRLGDLAINGSDVIAAGVKPGPKVGRTLQRVLEAVISEKVPNEKDALLEYVSAMAR